MKKGQATELASLGILIIMGFLIITTVYTNIYTPLTPDNCAYGGTCLPTEYKAGVYDTLDMVSAGFYLMSLMVCRCLCRLLLLSRSP
jgi:putative component of membrane protein insertase Oxa1/YidC/SpoIIIJ protein YidD